MGADDPPQFRYVAVGGYVDWIVFVGSSLADLVRAYSGLTGRIPMPLDHMPLFIRAGAGQIGARVVYLSLTEPIT